MTTIALDYDETYTADPKLWAPFLSLAKLNDVRVVIVTFRDEQLDRIDVTRLRDIPIYYTGGVAKEFFMLHFGEPIDVWIDDKPKTIFENSTFSPEGLAKWRENNALSKT